LVGLEMYSVRQEMAKDIFTPVRTVARMGYECVEFYGPYINWTMDQIKEMRKLLDELNLKCLSTHNGANNLLPENMAKTIEWNQTLGSKYIIMASAGKVEPTADGWKKVADVLTKADEIARKSGLSVGYHNHQMEWRPVEGQKPLEIIAKNTPQSVILQLDVGTCVETGNDPAAWIRSNPGRLKSIHCKDWSKEKGYRVLFGEGDSPWKAIFQAAESVGGVEFYLIEQEGYDLPPFETVEKCLANFRKIHSS
ncbi:MAG: sugar phosphate isomerase/epimerase family protein, partial [Bryobacteraceae bacterium]